jgi:hypothetical protein
MNGFLIAGIGLVVFIGIILWANYEAKKEGLNIKYD